MVPRTGAASGWRLGGGDPGAGGDFGGEALVHTEVQHFQPVKAARFSR